MRSRIGALHERYLRVLGFDRRPEGIEGLRELVRRHLCRVPFEKVSKLLLVGGEGAGRMTTLSEFLDGIEHRDLGGACYTNNPFLAGLLRVLGYDANLVGADMSTPNVHTSIRVRVAGAAYHVDVGYAGPFRDPIALDRLPRQILHGPYRYVFDRCRGGEALEMAVYRGADRMHGCAVHVRTGMEYLLSQQNGGGTGAIRRTRHLLAVSHHIDGARRPARIRVRAADDPPPGTAAPDGASFQDLVQVAEIVGPEPYGA